MLALFSRSAFTITLTDERATAAAQIMGDSKMPKAMKIMYRLSNKFCPADSTAKMIGVARMCRLILGGRHVNRQTANRINHFACHGFRQILLGNIYSTSLYFNPTNLYEIYA